MNNFLLASQTGGVTFIVLLSVMTVVVFALAVWLLCLGIKKDDLELKLKPKYIFIILLVVGAAIRMAVAFTNNGLVGTIVGVFSSERTGYTGMVTMIRSLINNGMNGFYQSFDGVYYYPLTMYILTFFGSISSLFWPVQIGSAATLVFVKLPFIISDILLAVVVYKIVNKFANDVVALAIGGLVAVCPVFMLGAIWPTPYSLLALAFAAMIYFMLERKYIALIISYAISLLVCFEAIFLLPIVAVFAIYAYVKKIKAFKAAKRSRKDVSVRDSEFNFIIKLPIAVLVCIIASYLLILPFALSGIGANPFVILYHYYIKPFDSFGYFTYNGLSLYTIFAKNGVKLLLNFPIYVFSILFMVAITAVVLIVYLSKKNRANLVLLTSYILLTVNTYFVNSSELTLLPFFVVLLIAFVVLKDKRLLKVFVIMALAVFINATGVFIKADYFSSQSFYVDELLSDKWAVLNIIASVITVLCHIYYTIVLLDIVMNGRLKKLNPGDGKITSAWKSFLQIKDN